MSRPNNRSGFTIIEVLIVLAVAGLILLLVFLAVPTMQRNTRNTTRKHAVELAVGAIEQHNAFYGHYPRTVGEADAFKASNPELSKPYEIEFYEFSGSHGYLPAIDTFAIEYGHWCNRYGNGNNDTDPIAGDHRSANLFAIWTQLEPEGTVFCVDNWDGITNL